MRVLLAFDKFKDCLTAPEACDVAAAAIRQASPQTEIDSCPTADGGDGFAAILTRAAGGELYAVSVRDPRGRTVAAPFGMVTGDRIPASARQRLNVAHDTRVGVIEMAAASGLALLAADERDVWQTHSFGTGELLAAAAEAGADAIVLGVGGSATSDLGAGALTALGLELRGRDGAPVEPAPAHWSRIAEVRGRLRSLPPVYIACDVTNPLLGPTGAAAVYGAQKGLKPEDLGRFDTLATQLAAKFCAWSGRPATLVNEPGTGAAGGITFGLRAGYGATLLPGFDFVTDWLDLTRRIAWADVVITGEGRFDASSLHGKGPSAIARQAAAAGKRVDVFAGAVAVAPPAGVNLHAITPPGTPVEIALRDCRRNLAAAIGAVFSSREFRASAGSE